MSAELCTKQCDRIKTALESLKDFGTESIIVFRRTEVELIGQDFSKVVDIRLLLPASKIRETGGYYTYECDDPEIVLGLRTKVVAGALKRIASDERVIIGARKGTQREFYVSCKNRAKTFTAEITAPLVAADAHAIPNVSGMFQYGGSIVMQSIMFHSVVCDLITAEPPVVTFDCDGRSLKLSGEGMFSRSCVEIGDSSGDLGVKKEEEEEDDDDDEEEEEEEDDKHEESSRLTALFRKSARANSGAWVVHESYATNHLQRIAKAKGMSPRISISIAQNVPASFEYDSPIGKLTYIVCARSMDDIEDPKFKTPTDVRASAPKRRRIALAEPPAAEYDSDGRGSPQQETQHVDESEDLDDF